MSSGGKEGLCRGAESPTRVKTEAPLLHTRKNNSPAGRCTERTCCHSFARCFTRQSGVLHRPAPTSLRGGRGGGRGAGAWQARLWQRSSSPPLPLARPPRRPAMLIKHGWGACGDSVASRAATFFYLGYIFIELLVGCVDFYSEIGALTGCGFFFFFSLSPWLCLTPAPRHFFPGRSQVVPSRVLRVGARVDDHPHQDQVLRALHDRRGAPHTPRPPLGEYMIRGALRGSP